MNADSIKIESDERGFELHVETDEGDRFAFNIHSCAEALHEQVNLIIGSWLAEGQAAKHSVRVSREALDAYELNDPKRASLEILLDGRDEVFV